MSDNKDLDLNEKKEVPEKGIAMELLGELKTQNKRLATILVIVLAMWFATIGGFIWYLNQYDFESYTVESNDGGNASYIGNDGDIFNGESQGSQENKEEQ